MELHNIAEIYLKKNNRLHFFRSYCTWGLQSLYTSISKVPRCIFGINNRFSAMAMQLLGWKFCSEDIKVNDWSRFSITSVLPIWHLIKLLKLFNAIPEILRFLTLLLRSNWNKNKRNIELLIPRQNRKSSLPPENTITKSREVRDYYFYYLWSRFAIFSFSAVTQYNLDQ